MRIPPDIYYSTSCLTGMGTVVYTPLPLRASVQSCYQVRPCGHIGGMCSCNWHDAVIILHLLIRCLAGHRLIVQGYHTIHMHVSRSTILSGLPWWCHGHKYMSIWDTTLTTGVLNRAEVEEDANNRVIILINTTSPVCHNMPI